MPKELKEPLYCCGELHKSGTYHRRTVHQQHTKISFKSHPEASFLLKRNSKTHLFHCPECDKSWAMATPIRNHIVTRCEGYVKYRSPQASSAVKTRAAARGQQAQEVSTGMQAVKEEGVEYSVEETQEHEHAAETAPLVKSPSVRSNVYVNSNDSGGDNLAITPEPLSPAAPNNSSPSPERVSVLRPAIWSPASASPSVRVSVSPSLLSVPPPLTQSVSTRSSTSSARTWPDDHPPGVPHMRFKTENDHTLLPEAASQSGSCSLSAARIFLDGLRRPLGNAAPQLHALGIVTTADLDLICTMPDAWDEVGDFLRGSGVTIIEWLMVKEAFKARAKVTASAA
ncbi:hypothetical protein BD311DRAFT_253434 [Dichomitus squalens]|uniref:Uncharacterized protein n=1 Tax=Dichomitus squalens TaxID=114155 RepID=A0A4Q9MPW0_9APHY|nr:hypothetical protein BD311DRAFT_253434 [Dichomitus squalens]